MHEQSLLTDILRKIEAVARENRAERLSRIRVKLGALSHISPNHFREHFERAAAGTAAEGADLEVELLSDIRDPDAQRVILDSVELPARARLRIELQGLVQGVGFRPCVHRLASDMHLTGWIGNDANGVMIEVEGSPEVLRFFPARMMERLPPLARIHTRRTTTVPLRGEQAFSIVDSDAGGLHKALVLPDTAICAACLAEIRNPRDRRYRYPFTNCTDCGPRFSIIESLPYDRARTTMRTFTMCEACQTEYENPDDRRFHAQANACPECGPRIELRDSYGRLISTADQALQQACDLIRRGRIVALKGLGGFQLLVDARNEAAVQELRRRKMRPTKPLAIMCPSMESARSLCDMNDLEASSLRSPQSPIVLMRRRRAESRIAPIVAPGNPCLGVMLPYTPLHHLLVDELDFPIVATSGNNSSEPICIDNDEALNRLRGIADFFLTHDRPIARRMDDSVVQLADGAVMLLRSARGYAPTAIPLEHGDESLMALGGHLKGSVAVAVGKTAILGQHLGDLDTLPSTRAFAGEAESIQRLHAMAPSRLITDIHPDYYSSIYGESRNLPLCKVQHHLAHLLSCAIENRIKPPVLGVVWDGAGLGSDGTVWGGEFIEVNGNGWKRVARLRHFRLPGGDAAARDPRRCALGLLFEIYGEDIRNQKALLDRLSWSVSEIDDLLAMLRNDLNCPLTSSAGRLFDGVAAMLGVADCISFEAEAAMRLQFMAESGDSQGSYACSQLEEGELQIVDWAAVVEGILDDRASGVPSKVIARKFHITLAQQVAEVVGRLGAERVVLSGGCFQNRLLLELTLDAVRETGAAAYGHRLVPPNDGGLALGQLVAAALDFQEGK